MGRWGDRASLPPGRSQTARGRQTKEWRGARCERRPRRSDRPAGTSVSTAIGRVLTPKSLRTTNRASSLSITRCVETGIIVRDRLNLSKPTQFRERRLSNRERRGSSGPGTGSMRAAVPSGRNFVDSIEGRCAPYVTTAERIQRKTQDFLCVVIAAGSLCCASPDTPPRFQLTMIGIHVGYPVRISSTVSRERRADPDSEHPTPAENLPANCRQLASNPSACYAHLTDFSRNIARSLMKSLGNRCDNKAIPVLLRPVYFRR